MNGSTTLGAVANVTDYVANGSFESLRLNVETSSTPNHAVLVRLVDHNNGWTGPFVYVDESSYKFLKKSRLAPGDVIVANVGANAGTVFRVPDLGKAVTLGPNSVVCHPRDIESCDRAYLYYFLSSPLGQSLVSGIITGSAQPKFNKTSFRQLPITLPGIEDQRAIAEVLGALDDKIAANTKLATTLMGLLDAQFEQLGLDRELQDNSEIVSIDEFVELNPKVAAPNEAEPVYVDMQKLPTDGMSIREWDHRPAKGGARFMNGDTLLARITPCLENRKTGFVDFLDEGQIGIGSTEFIVLRSRPGISPALSYFIATSQRFRTFAIRHMVGTSGRQRVSALDLTGYTLREPEEGALARFGDAAKSTFQLLKSLTDESRTLATTRDALIPQLMSGKLLVKDAEKVLEEAGI